jgi:ATP-dependent DNA ligase
MLSVGDLELMVARPGPLPHGAGWTFEAKLDGWRAAIARPDDRVRIRSRHGRDLARFVPELAAAAAALPSGVVLDGEIVVAAAGGVDFTALQDRLTAGRRELARYSTTLPATMAVFDLLADVDGLDVRGWSQARRRERLSVLLARGQVRVARAGPQHTGPRGRGAVAAARAAPRDRGRRVETP